MYESEPGIDNNSVEWQFTIARGVFPWDDTKCPLVQNRSCLAVGLFSQRWVDGDTHVYSSGDFARTHVSYLNQETILFMLDGPHFFLAFGPVAFKNFWHS